MQHPIRVLIADDSIFARQMLRRVLAQQPDITVLEPAVDGADAVDKVIRHRPDVVVMDLEMPRLDGFGAIAEIMRLCPTPIVVFSSLAGDGTAATIRALTLGAVDYVLKPGSALVPEMAGVEDDLVAKIRRAARTRPRPIRPDALTEHAPGFPASEPAPPAEGSQMPAASPSGARRRHHFAVGSAPLVVIGTSTGGPSTLMQILPALPPNPPCAMLIVQHMPAGFTRSLAERLNNVCRFPVREAADGDAILPGCALVAPGGFHMQVTAQQTVLLTTDPPLHGVRPAVDITLESAAANWCAPVLSVVLTGMGADGARGSYRVRRAGGRCIAQDEASCVVNGMPRAAVEAGAADEVLSLEGIPAAIVRHVRDMSGAAWA